MYWCFIDLTLVFDSGFNQFYYCAWVNKFLSVWNLIFLLVILYNIIWCASIFSNFKWWCLFWKIKNRFVGTDLMYLTFICFILSVSLDWWRVWQNHGDIVILFELQSIVFIKIMATYHDSPKITVNPKTHIVLFSCNMISWSWVIRFTYSFFYHASFTLTSSN